MANGCGPVACCGRKATSRELDLRLTSFNLGIGNIVPCSVLDLRISGKITGFGGGVWRHEEKCGTVMIGEEVLAERCLRCGWKQVS